jgi:hydroxymethylpyrimidine/phosphomethylpyrimidine kinase
MQVALTIAGSDSGGGAGIQADLRTFERHQLFGTSVITAITAQNTQGVFRVGLLEPVLIQEQLQAVLEDFKIGAIKIGMLGGKAQVEAVAEVLEKQPRLPIVVLDPVLCAKGGAVLLEPDAIRCLKERLLPLCTLVTPNLPENEVLGELVGAVLLKGGHGEGSELVDRLYVGDQEYCWRHPKVQSRNTHGTGCVLSSAIAARLCRGEELVDAVGGAIAYVQERIEASKVSVGRGQGPLL